MLECGQTCLRRLGDVKQTLSPARPRQSMARGGATAADFPGGAP